MIARRVVLDAAIDRLRAAEVPSPEYDATALLAHVLGLSRAGLATVEDIARSAVEEYDALVARRAAREPLQHLVGAAGFRHVELAVGPGVFVPRPETELLAGWAIEQVVGRLEADPAGECVVVDLCTGSGAIALSIADEAPRARIHAVELDPGAHHWALRNLGDAEVDLRLGDMETAFEELRGAVDVVVCNPPYIPLDAWESVAPEARDHDPHLALFSGADGLDAIRVVERRAAELLRPTGVVGVEHADAQGDAVPAVFAESGRWSDIRDHADLAGRARFTTARLAR